MRKIILIAFPILFAYNNTVAQFKWLNPTPSGYVNTKLSFINKDTGFLFNQAGDLLKTGNGAVNWQPVKNFPYTNVMDFAFTTGIIAGWAGTIYISSDNGQSWVNKNSQLIGNIKKADIVSRDTIIIGTDIGNVYKTNNRGNTWIPMVTPVAARSLEFVNSKFGFILAYDGIYRTADGGNTWQRVYANNNSAMVLTIKFYNTMIGYAYRDGDEMLKTIDGGTTWISSNLGDDMNDIFFVNDNKAYAVGEHGAMYRTVNAGTTWTWMGAGPRTYAHDLFSMHFFNDSTGLVVGHRGMIMKTTNSGLNWQKYAPTYIDVTNISFGTNNTGYATTWNNIYKTNDKGQTWNELAFSVGTIYPSNERFELLHFFNADTGIVTKSDFPLRIYKTVDGGQNWNVTTTLQPYTATTGMSFINSTTGFASFSDLSSSNQFGIYKTIDAGTSWQLVNNTNRLLKIQFVNEQVGYGNLYRKLYKTTDGGNNWQEILVNPDSDIDDMYFITTSKGFAIGHNGYLKMTLDGGLTWTSVVPNGLYDYFIKIRFFDDKAGYVTTRDGKIYKTVDGGLSWKAYKNHPFYENRAIAFTPDSSVYIGGMYGTILSNKIAEFSIDSVKADPVSSCKATLSAKIGADFSSVDSIWFQYGTNDFTNTVLGNPSNVNNSKVVSAALATNLDHSTAYKLRVKLLYKGIYHYSDVVYFTTASSLTPVITDSVTFLQSSAFSGNQWFLNGQIIAGEISQRIIPQVSGIYKVQLNENGCLSPFSNEINFTYVGDTSLENRTLLYPNPSNDLFQIKNSDQRTLQIQVADLHGRVVYTSTSSNILIAIPIKKLSPGYLYVTITDAVSKEKITRTILKL